MEDQGNRNGKVIRVAICQFDSNPPNSPSPSMSTSETDVKSDPSQKPINTSLNLDKLEHFVFMAAHQRAELIVLPEYFITGVISDHLHLASKEGQWIEVIKNLAIEHSIDIVAGSIVEKISRDLTPDQKLSSGSERLYNTAYYVNKKGEIIGRYRKKNLWHPERDYLTACTDDHQVFDTEHFRAGMLLCWDLAWPEAFRELMKKGAEVIIVPAFWVLQDIGPIGRKHDPSGKTERKMLDSMVMTRAFENECCVIFVNCGGSGKEGYLGGSTIAMPLKGSLIIFDNPEERLEVVEIDLDVLKDARSIYKIREDYPSKLKEG
ncbi:hypothetical protein CROQUDRAFT_656027 [Cronartium quercuum f. sp. fusiforme G11]|uniref:CN hydrolase domain-containing protein n=1 Tax=Cronartium quercuum f. sp. fusiforme G11 TaxID=708437 RepID=A0A9P6NPZ5_9BASI|nr:hypothetical protein CROQUDRAFT_656027 [Cronartium quercuum f. sp. fusiforme G11]